ncbi:NYN domain-containing protein [Micromonospora globbae]|uniref:NYN domain-containing protein n=1 Tax=Micromonospora globbae TaxID=1894969 RepID=UPI003864F478|nr:NYN domain-containing protein [Micromonospora globbae]
MVLDLVAEYMVRTRLVGLVDAGFIVKSGRALLGEADISYEGVEIVNWLQTVATRLDMKFLRAYWYDGAYPMSDRKLYDEQRTRFAQLEACPGIQLRLGHLQPRPFDFKPALRAATQEMGISYQELMQHLKLEKLYQQKGVDTLLVLDMLRLVQQNACDALVLMAGDRDLAEAVRTVQQLGATVIVAHPESAPVSDELRDLADERIRWSEDLTRRLTTRFADRLDRLLDAAESARPIEPGGL